MRQTSPHGFTVTTKLHCAWFPQASTAVHVTVVLPTGKVVPEGGVHARVRGPLQLSVACESNVTTGWSQPTVMFPGHVITGGVVSTTVMCWMQVEVLPQPSVAFQVRSIPASPAQPAGVGVSLNVTVTRPEQLSPAVAEPVWAGSVDSPHWSCRSRGQAITGGVVSMKVMCWTQVAVLPQPSVAFHVRSTPGRPVQPAGVAASLNVMVTGAPQLSVAVADPVLLGPVEAPHWSCLSGGQVITGAVVSAEMMCWMQVAVLLQSSVV